MASVLHNDSVQDLLQAFLVDSSEKARSKDEFLKRLASFSLSTWSGKSQEISPLQCARYGWFNSDVDFLKCASCESVLCGQLPKRCQLELHKKSVKKLSKELTDAHHKHCPWRNNPSPEPYYNMSRWNKEEVQNEFLNYLNQLLSLKSELPILQDSYSNSIEDALETVQKLFPDHKLTLPIAQLAIRGWTCNANSDKNCCTIYCAYCVRRVGLWNYKSNEENVCDNPNKKQKLNDDVIEKKAFNPILEHQIWCPWVSTSKETNEMGWKNFFDVLTNKFRKLNNGTSVLNSKPRLGKIREWLSI